jgi:hypothetical protein
MTKVARIDDAQARVAETIKARLVVFFMKAAHRVQNTRYRPRVCTPSGRAPISLPYPSKKEMSRERA